jgi:hypothetical protein
MLITELNDMFHNATLYAAFADNRDICIASSNIPRDIDLDYVLISLTGSSVNEFLAS